MRFTDKQRLDFVLSFGPIEKCVEFRGNRSDLTHFVDVEWWTRADIDKAMTAERTKKREGE